MSIAQANRATRADLLDVEAGHSIPLGWSDLRVDREDIGFSTIRSGVLKIEITVHNDGKSRSAPTVALLQSAPLGAFARWRPLGIVNVPSIKPRGSTVVRHEVEYRPAVALGGAEKIPPSRLLTALDPEDADPNRGLADDLLGLLGQGGVHWVGNLNLFFPGKDVERHLAQALRVYPGRVNIAMFIVGTIDEDAYRFQLTGDAVDWEARLLDTAFDQPVASSAKSGDELLENKWHHPSTGLILLALKPPECSVAGIVNVVVRQKSTNREATVEFTLDSSAAGPGCYVI